MDICTVATTISIAHKQLGRFGQNWVYRCSYGNACWGGLGSCTGWMMIHLKLQYVRLFFVKAKKEKEKRNKQTWSLSKRKVKYCIIWCSWVAVSLPGNQRCVRPVRSELVGNLFPKHHHITPTSGTNEVWLQCDWQKMKARRGRVKESDITL